MSAILNKPDTTTSKPTPAADWRFKKFGLSRQESRVMELAMEGHIDKQIALEIGISLGTVRVYWKRIRSKTRGTRSESIANLAKDSLQNEYDDLQRRADTLQTQLNNRRETERRIRAFETAFRCLPVAMAVVEGSSSKIVMASEEFARHFGYESQEVPDAAIFAEPLKAALALSTVTLKPKSCRLAVRSKGGDVQTVKLSACGDPESVAVIWADE
jgi:DNA-binding CsgD family transcriptional regulator